MSPGAPRAADAATVEKPAVVRAPLSGLPAVADQLESDIVEGTRALVARRETAALLLIPAIVYFWFVHVYGVNAIWYDQWDNIALLTHSNYFYNSYAGHTSLSMLWTQHNENRMLFPNLVVLALGALTHLNVLTEEYLSAALLSSPRRSSSWRTGATLPPPTGSSTCPSRS